MGFNIPPVRSKFPTSVFERLSNYVLPPVDTSMRSWKSIGVLIPAPACEFAISAAWWSRTLRMRCGLNMNICTDVAVSRTLAATGEFCMNDEVRSDGDTS